MDKDYYKTPESEVMDDTIEGAISEHLGLRWGRAKYFIFCLGFFMLHVVITLSFAMSGLAIPPEINLIVMLVVHAYMTSFRVRDFNRSGYLALIMLIPLLSYILIIIFSLIPGNSGANRYGYPGS